MRFEKKQDPDFGWRLSGRVVTVMPDHSRDLDESRRIPSFVEAHLGEIGNLRSCLQCGACTATCELAGEGSLLPRRQVTGVKLGLEERLVEEPEIWQCHGCNDCSARCPSGAMPGR